MCTGMRFELYGIPQTMAVASVPHLHCCLQTEGMCRLMVCWHS